MNKRSKHVAMLYDPLLPLLNTKIYAGTYDILFRNGTLRAPLRNMKHPLGTRKA